MSFVLIDPPVNPFSPKDEIQAWVEYCRKRFTEQPDSREWKEALDEALRILELADKHDPHRH